MEERKTKMNSLTGEDLNSKTKQWSATNVIRMAYQAGLSRME